MLFITLENNALNYLGFSERTPSTSLAISVISNYCKPFQATVSLCFSINIVTEYWLLGVSIHWSGQFSKPGFCHLSNLIPKSDYNKYNQTGH